MTEQHIVPEAGEYIERLRTVPAANVGDAQERIGVLDGDIRALWDGARVVGPAVTCWTREGDNLGLHAAIADADAGDVIVVNGHGFSGRALMGELMAGRAKAKGIAGFVIDGYIRDLADFAAMGMPVFARGTCPAGPYKHGPFRLGGPVAVGGVAVLPGDVIVADGDGVTVIAAASVAEITAAAEAVQADEAQRRAKIGLQS